MSSSTADELSTVEQTEAWNLTMSRQALGETHDLAQDFFHTYEALTDLVRRSNVAARDELVAAGQFLYACRYQLVVSLLDVLRGHISNAHCATRKAIELCAFAARVSVHPHLAMIWLQAGSSDESYEKYREKFNPGKLFPEDHAILGPLYERFDICSKQCHPSLYSLAGQIRVVESGEEIRIDFSYFQLSGAEAVPDLARAFLWTLDTHFQILRVFFDVFGGLIAADKRVWDVRYSSLEAALLTHKGRWRSTIDPIGSNDEP